MKRQLLAIAVAVWSSVSLAKASEYPHHSITFVVPFAAGGPLDTLARIMAERMSRSLGQSIVIENVAGAGGGVGVERVVHSPPDGYTISVGNWSTHVLNGAIYTLRYDLVSDLEPVALLPSAPQIIVARKGIEATTLPELIAWTKAHQATLGTAGVGSAGHVSAVLFEKRTGAHVALVHYRGGGPAMTDLIGGHIDLMFDQSTTCLPQIKQGTVRAFAATSEARLSPAPEIPTTDEAGLSDFHVAVWSGLWAPKGTPSDAIRALSAATRESLSDPAIRERLENVGLTLPSPEQVSPEGLAELQKAEIATWWPILKAANVRSE
jgi:tripartite-type tricarboxylate transporter receptor subunit TctC